VIGMALSRTNNSTDERNAWIDGRLTEAVRAATSEAHAFPEEVIAEFRRLLSAGLQEPKKPAELDEIASSLNAANGGFT
jgi:hypothetical protein